MNELHQQLLSARKRFVKKKREWDNTPIYLRFNFLSALLGAGTDENYEIIAKRFKDARLMIIGGEEDRVIGSNWGHPSTKVLEVLDAAIRLAKLETFR